MGESSHAAVEHKRGTAERKPSPGLVERSADPEPSLALDSPSLAVATAGDSPAADGNAWAGNLEGRHAALLADTRLSGAASQARQVRLLQGLQRGYGNGHVARVLQRAAIQRAVADCPAPPLEKPRLEPIEDPKFKQVEGKVKQVAAAEKKHPPAKAKVAEAQAAAQPPANDTASQAAAAQVGTMAAQKPGTFNKQAFIGAVRKAIEAASPKNMDEADSFKDSGKAAQVKDQVGGLVTTGKDDSQHAIKESTEATPDASKATPKSVTAMPEERPGKQPADVGAAGAMPSPKSGAEVSLAHGPCEINNQMADAEVTEDQLRKSNEPEFSEAVDAKKKTEEHAATAPDEYRAKEQQTLEKEKADAAAGASATTAAMHTTKVGTANKVGADKVGAKAKDEAARAQVAKQIEDIYNRAKSDVTKILADLDPLVDKTFKEGEEQARNEFTSYVKAKTDAYKDERYSGVLGWGRWLKDKFKTNPDLNKFIDDGRAKYMAKMDVVISNVADIIGRELTRAKDRIAQGRTEVKEYVAKLPKDLKQAGAEGQSKIESQFDQLESDVNEKQDGLVQSLAQKYTAARDALDEEANKMKEDNKGLVDKAKDAVVGVIQTILKLKDMLLGVLAKAASEIGKIIKDPIGFLGNLVNAIKTGLNQFVSNIGTHLKKALMGWLFGALGDAGIQLPESFDLKGILSLILQVLGLTYDNIRGIAVNLVGEKVVAAAEGTVKVLITLVKEGPAGLWEWIKEKIAEINIKEMVIGAIKDFVITKIITAGITWLIGFLNPAAAFIKACKMIYDIIMFFIERGSQIMEFVNSVLDGIGAIAAGNISSAANLVESSLAKILPLAISFLAAALGVGGIAEKIKEIIEKIRAPITKLVTAVLGPILKPLKKLYDKGAKFVKGVVDKGKALGQKALDKVKEKAKAVGSKVKGLFGGKGKDGARSDPKDRTTEQKQADLDTAIKSATRLLKGQDATHQSVEAQLPALKQQYHLNTLELVLDKHEGQEETVHVRGTVNPTGEGDRVQIGTPDLDAEIQEVFAELHGLGESSHEAQAEGVAKQAAAQEAKPKTKLSDSSATLSEASLRAWLGNVRTAIDNSAVSAARKDRLHEQVDAALSVVADRIAAARSAEGGDSIFGVIKAAQKEVNRLIKDFSSVEIQTKKKASHKRSGLETHHAGGGEVHQQPATHPEESLRRTQIPERWMQESREWATAQFKGKRISKTARKSAIRQKLIELNRLSREGLNLEKRESRGQAYDEPLEEVDMLVYPAVVHMAAHADEKRERQTNIRDKAGDPLN